VCLLLAALIAVVGLLADLLSANRRALWDIRAMLRRAELDGRD
jgi:hypothetical protein